MEKGLELLNVNSAAQKDWAPLMDAGRHNVQDRAFMCDGAPACTLDKIGHRVPLQQHATLIKTLIAGTAWSLQ